MNGRKKALFLAVVLIAASLAVLHPIQIGSSEPVEAYYPSAYNLLGATANVSGEPTDLQSDDGQYMTFRSYFSGTDTQDYVDNNTSDVDSSADKGTHSNFTAQQYGPDSIYDTLTEENTGSASANVLTNPSFTGGTNGWNLSVTTYDPIVYQDSAGSIKTITEVGRNKVSTGTCTQTIGTPISSNDTVKLSLWWKKNYTSSVLVQDIRVEIAKPSAPDVWVTIWQDTQTGDIDWTQVSELNVSSYFDETGTYNYRYYMDLKNPNDASSQVWAWFDNTTLKVVSPPNYELDLEVQWASADFDEANEELCIYGGTMGAEDVRVDVWNGSEWINLFTDLSTGWNNVSVTSYLTSTTFAIRFKGTTETGDTNQDTWQIDCTLLHVWTNEYTTEVEFTGTSNTQDWTQLVWTIDSAWTTGSVAVTLQLYNYTLGDYPTSGDGYIAYTSSVTSNVDETKNQTITTNPTNFRDNAGNWKIRIKGVKSTATPFNFKADLIKYETTALVHDVAVLSVTPSSTTVYPGQTVNITVIVENQGDATETFNVTTYYNDTIIETQNVTNLASGANTTLLFIWNTTGVAEGDYTIKAEASVVPGETDTADNILVSGDTVTITAAVHDIAIINVAPSQTLANPNRMVNITVVAENQGTETETFNVTAYYDNVPIGTQTVTNLVASANITLTFVWNTTGVAEDTYTIKAVADTVPGETDTLDNTFIDDTVTIVKPTVAVSPNNIIGPGINDTFTINITISNVVDLYAWQAGMTFNPSVLQCVNFTEGPFLKEWAEANNQTTLWTSGTINNTAGVITYHSCSLTGPIPGAAGNGTLATIAFKVVDYGNSTLHLTDVILLDSTLTEIPCNTTDGYFRLPQPPVASFTYSPPTPYTGETVTFNATASYDPDGTIVSYSWDFGDGANATGVVVEHAYADNGTYTVTLTVIDNDGLNSTESKSITVLNTPPVALFTESATTVPTGTVIYFNASDSYDPDGSIVSYFWDFGDGTNATGMTAEHAYADDGSYTVTLTVTDNDGATGTDTATKTISNRPPIASFTENATVVDTGVVIHFNASDSYDPDGSIVSYFWDFGDGTNATGMIVDHAYADDGTYTVTLTVTDDDYATDTETATKTILNRSPFALFTENATTVQTGVVIRFNASASYDPDGVITSYFWDFGDGTNATGMIVDHAYADDGVYTVNLTVTDDDGATNSTDATKTVLNRPPVAFFTENATVVDTGVVIGFNASASYDPDGFITEYFWDFGDETNTTGVIVDHAYADNGTYTVTLTVTDDDGATNSTSSSKTVLNRSPVANFTESAETVLTDEVIYFNASGSSDPDGYITSYFWDFADGTNATGVTVEHSYTDNGTYTVTLTVTDDDGATASSNATKIVGNRPPIANFTESATTVYIGESITFNASASYDPDGSIISYFWTFGDGTNATGVIVNHAYADNGEYLVTLTVTDNDGATASSSAIKTVMNRSPVASFTESTTTALTNEVIYFNASESYDPDGLIVSYFWDFGDGTSATGVTVSHAYVDDGVYTVTLTVTDDDDATASKSDTKTILNRSPVASFTESAETVLTDETITFNASQSYDPDGSVVSYFWDFGDGTNFTGIIVDHAYVDDGVYTVTLTVTDNDGAAATDNSTKTILNRSPVALFTETAETVYTGENIYFNASSSYDPDGTVVNYFWDFSDGANATGVVVEHSYADDGNYTVTLNVTDDDGATNSTSASKTVLNRSPVANFTESAETVLTDEVIYFNASGSSDPDGSITSYFWNFGDGTNATGVTVNHSYADDGNYTVTLTVTDDDGATDTATSTKTILNRPPIALFTESAETVETLEGISFNATDSYDLDGYIADYFWDFGDGANGTGIIVDHAYADDGFYTVTLTVTDDDGATASESANKTILNRSPVANFTESAETVLTGETISFNASASSDPDGTIASYFWDFGDDTNATGVTVDHSYADNGTYTVTLTVTDDDGATNSSISTKTVFNRPPVASFTESAHTVLIGEVIYFNASASYDPDGSIVSYFWDFGDGTNATGMIVEHVYTVAGNYTVSLTVTDDDGATATANATKTAIYVAPDVAVLSVMPSNTEAYPTWVVPINITVVVENQGTLTETFNVTVYYNETAIETKSVTLAAGANTTLIFSWNLTGLSPGNYTIKAEASVLPGETDTADNTLTSDVTVKLKQPGDANDDGILNVYDTAILGKAWGTSVGDPYYDPRADFNGDGTIDDYDLQILQLYWP